MRLVVLVLFLLVSLVLLFPYFTRQGLLYWQYKENSGGRISMTCSYISGFIVYDVVDSTESWVNPNRKCEVLVPLR